MDTRDNSTFEWRGRKGIYLCQYLCQYLACTKLLTTLPIHKVPYMGKISRAELQTIAYGKVCDSTMHTGIITMHNGI